MNPPSDQPSTKTTGLAQSIWEGLKPKAQQSISPELLQEALDGMKLNDLPEPSENKERTPTLKINRLRLKGTKHWKDREAEAFDHQMGFQGGVNVICVPHNLVGKSTLLKTIKFAFTGDNGDFDPDMDNWIEEVWLNFEVSGSEFTVMHHRNTSRMVLLPGNINVSMDEALGHAALAFCQATGVENIRKELQSFFFKRLRLVELSWYMKSPTNLGELDLCSTSWLTYFQALFIKDDGDQYLLVPDKHQIGGQGGKIFATFLGIELNHELNQASLADKSVEHSAQVQSFQSEQRTTQMQGKVASLKEERDQVQGDINALRQRLKQRQTAFSSHEDTLALADLKSRLVLEKYEYSKRLVEREELNRNIRHMKNQIRKAQEAIDFSVQLTGLQVTLCPSCDHEVDETAILREKEHHTCRLCGKEAHIESEAELQQLKDNLEHLHSRLEILAGDRKDLLNDISRMARSIEQLELRIPEVQKVVDQGWNVAQFTPEEEVEMDRLNERKGSLNWQLAETEREMRQASSIAEDFKRQKSAVQVIKNYLKSEAETRNASLLQAFSELTEQYTRKIGTSSISNLKVYTSGLIKLQKHGEHVSFDGIQNQGERLRLKLAFFLSLLQISRQEGYGHHPGFLMIDQPGGGEMVEEDFAQLAHILRDINDTYGEDLQIICATARPVFQEATTPDKVYGLDKHSAF